MRSNMTGRKRVAASVAVTALLAGGMALAAPGAASASPVLGSADAATGFVNDLGLWPVAADEKVKAPDLTVTPNDDGTVGLTMTNVNTGNYSACGIVIVPALETPPDGLATAGLVSKAVYPANPVDGFTTGTLSATTQALDPGLYAVVSSCTAWKDGGAFLDPEADPIGSTANQPYFFATLGTLGEMS